MNKISYISWLRVFAMFSILLCHILSSSGDSFLIIGGQIFNIGVQIFIILSGFLFGIEGNQEIAPLKWFKKRLIRIYIPYELFLFVLSCIYLLINNSFDFSKWGLMILGIHGFGGVNGAEHTWYITAILICYVLTPFISYIYNFSSNKKELKKIIMILFLLFPALIPLIFGSNLSYFICPVLWYSTAYFCGRNKDKIEKLATIKHCLISIIIIILLFFTRFISNIYIDGTLLYNNIIVQYEHYISAFCIFLIFIFIFKNHNPHFIIKVFDNISFEIYLYHYMFIIGPISLLNLTKYYWLNSIIIVVCSILIAFIFNKVTNYINKLIRNKI